MVADARDVARGLTVHGEVANPLSGGMGEIGGLGPVSLRETGEPGEHPIEFTVQVGHRAPWRRRNERIASRPVWAMWGPCVKAAVVYSASANRAAVSWF